MSAPDFAAIIDAEINDYTDWDTPGSASMVLAAKVPAESLADRDLPPSVVAWVMGGES